MKAAVLKSTRNIIIEDRPVPKLEVNQTLIRVKAAGICGSDLHGFQGIWPDKRAAGLVMGHENAGEIVEVGAGVTDYKIGERVVIDPQLVCGSCDECMQGWPNVCSNMKLIGSSSRGICNGGFSEYISMPSRNLHRLPENLTFEEGVLFDAIGNAIHLVSRAQIKPADRVAIVGAGTLGLSLLLVTQISGAGMITISDMSPYRLNIASELGADICINVNDKDPVSTIMAATQGKGVDFAIEAVGKKETYQQCLAIVKKRGKILALGNMANLIELELFRLVSREISIIGCTGFSPLEVERAIELMASGKIDVKPLITHTFPLEQAQVAFEFLDRNGHNAIKAILLP